jgi:hypothetical protein
MTIDPRWGFWFSVIAALVSGLLLCGAEFTTLFGDVSTGKILAGLGIGNVVINSLNAVLHAIPAAVQTTVGAAKAFYLGPAAK